MSIVKRIIIGLSFLIGLVFVYLVAIIFFPIMSLPKQPIPRRKKENDELGKPPVSRQNVQFSVNGININAWLYWFNEQLRFGGSRGCIENSRCG